MLTDKIEPIISNGVENIGGYDLIPKGIGTVRWSWTDDEGKPNTNKLNNLPYFTYPPVNILSETALTESMKYYEGTCVLTKTKYSIFNLDFRRYKKIIAHSENCLLELDIQDGFSKFAIFFKRVG